MDGTERLLIEIEQRSKSNTHRIDTLETTTLAVHELAISVKLLAQSTEQMAEQLKKQGDRLDKLEATPPTIIAEQLKKHDSRIDELEKVPAKNWHLITKTIITSIISILCGGAVGAVIAFMALNSVK